MLRCYQQWHQHVDTSINFAWTFSVQLTLKVASILVTNSTTKYKFLCSFASYYNIGFLFVFKLAAYRKCVMLYIITASVHTTSLQEFSSNNTGSESDIGMHALSASFFSHKCENEMRIRTRRLHSSSQDTSMAKKGLKSGERRMFLPKWKNEFSWVIYYNDHGNGITKCSKWKLLAAARKLEITDLWLDQRRQVHINKEHKC